MPIGCKEEFCRIKNLYRLVLGSTCIGAQTCVTCWKKMERNIFPLSNASHFNIAITNPPPPPPRFVCKLNIHENVLCDHNTLIWVMFIMQVWCSKILCVNNPTQNTQNIHCTHIVTIWVIHTDLRWRDLLTCACNIFFY